MSGATGGWGTGPWGLFPWGGALPEPPATILTYFMPPVFRVYPLDEPRHRAIRMTWWHHMGSNIEIAGVTYLGGRWNGPLTDTQIAAITAAGYGGRLVQAADLGLLPSGID